MKPVFYATISLLLIESGVLANNINGFHAPELTSSIVRTKTLTQAQPTIWSARRKGKKLIVIGENFGNGMLLLVNGIIRVTRFEPDQQTPALIAAKAGKKIPRDEVVKLQVQTSDGLLSNELFFYTGLTITAEDNQKTVRLRVGEKFLLTLLGGPYECNVTGPDETVVKKVTDASQIAGAQGVFEAVQAGETKISAFCTIPCKTPPNCALAPPLAFKVDITVE